MVLVPREVLSAHDTKVVLVQAPICLMPTVQGVLTPLTALLTLLHNMTKKKRLLILYKA